MEVASPESRRGSGQCKWRLGRIVVRFLWLDHLIYLLVLTAVEERLAHLVFCIQRQGGGRVVVVNVDVFFSFSSNSVKCWVLLVRSSGVEHSPSGHYARGYSAAAVQCSAFLFFTAMSSVNKPTSNTRVVPPVHRNASAKHARDNVDGTHYRPEASPRIHHSNVASQAWSAAGLDNPSVHLDYRGPIV